MAQVMKDQRQKGCAHRRGVSHTPNAKQTTITSKQNKHSILNFFFPFSNSNTPKSPCVAEGFVQKRKLQKKTNFPFHWPAGLTRRPLQNGFSPPKNRKNYFLSFYSTFSDCLSHEITHVFHIFASEKLLTMKSATRQLSTNTS